MLPRVLLLLGTVLATALCAPTARAAATPERAYLDDFSPPPSDWRLMGTVGLYDGTNAGGIVLGGTLRFRYEAIVAGGKLELGTGLFSDHVLGSALLIGLSSRPHRNFRLELTGEFGAHQYSNVGAEFLGDDPGTEGTSSYAGARATLSIPFGRKSRHFELGFYLDFQDDLTRQRITYTYPTRDGWFGGGELDGGTAQASHVIGNARVGFGIELGRCHDLW